MSFIFLMSLVSCTKDNKESGPVIKIGAGNDIGNIDNFWVTLNADSLKSGESGQWSVEKGLVDEKVYFKDSSSPKTVFHGLPGEKYLLQWKVLFNNKYYEDSVHVQFNPIKVKIIKEGLNVYSTRIRLNAGDTYSGKWTISGGNLQKISPTSLPWTEAAENCPDIELFGWQNETLYAKWIVTYGSVSFSDTIIYKTGNYNEYEALEDLELSDSPGSYKLETGHVVELYLGENGAGGLLLNFSTTPNFTTLPALCSLIYLKKLVLNGDLLYTFPDVITSYYKNLIYLDMGNNCLNRLPSNIGNLKYLETFILNNQQDNNFITQLPDSFCNLVNLKYLDLSESNLSQLPSNFGNLNKLETLLLYGSNLNELPSSFGNLNSLKYFHISGIINNLPESFSQLTNLTEFSSGGGSSITKLPDNIGNLKSLKSFSYEGNMNLASLPNSFCNLDSLNVLVLAGNLEALPDNFGNLKSLQNLNLYANLKELPQSFSKLTSLKYLTLTSPKDKNPVFILPQNIGQLANIEAIDISGTNLFSVPNSIGSLSSLREISFINCSLDSVPASIGNLTNLQTINLAGNNLSSIPENFKNLKGLNQVNLNGNVNLAWQIDQIKSWNMTSNLIY